MGAVVSSSEEKYESVFAKRCFEKYVVADVYELCALSKRVMAPVMRRRVAEGWNLKKGDDECVESGSDDGSGTESESGSASDSDDSDGGGGAASSGPLTSLFGVDLTYADYFDVFGPGCFAHSEHFSDASLCLPLDLYKLFDRDSKGLVPALELFVALALYSTGHVKDRMAFCFMVFDDDGNNSLDRNEMLVLIRAATRTLFKLGDLPAVPSMSVVKRVRDDLFAKYTAGGVEKEALDINDFFDWAKESKHSSALMDKFNRVASQLKKEAVEAEVAKRIKWTFKPTRHVHQWWTGLKFKNSYDFAGDDPLDVALSQTAQQLKRLHVRLQTADKVKQSSVEDLHRTAGGAATHRVGGNLTVDSRLLSEVSTASSWDLPPGGEVPSSLRIKKLASKAAEALGIQLPTTSPVARPGSVAEGRVRRGTSPTTGSPPARPTTTGASCPPDGSALGFTATLGPRQAATSRATARPTVTSPPGGRRPAPLCLPRVHVGPSRSVLRAASLEESSAVSAEEAAGDHSPAFANPATVTSPHERRRVVHATRTAYFSTVAMGSPTGYGGRTRQALQEFKQRLEAT